MLFKIAVKQAISNLTCIAVFLTGIGVLVGWATQNLTILQIVKNFPSMQINTAICLILTSLSILIIRRFKYLSGFLSLIVIAISATTLLEYMFEVHLGINELVYTLGILPITELVGRMAPNTAFSIFILNLIILTNSIYHRRLIRKLMLVLCLLVGSVAIAGLVECSIGISEDSLWFSYSKMALHTAICLLALSYALFSKIGSFKTIKTDPQDSNLPLLILIVGFLGFSLAWEVLYKNYYYNLKKSVIKNQTMIAGEFEKNLGKSISMIQRIANKKILDYYKNESFLEQELTDHVNQIKQIKSVVVNLRNPPTLQISKYEDLNLNDTTNENPIINTLIKNCKDKLDRTAVNSKAPNLKNDFVGRWMCFENTKADMLFILDSNEILLNSSDLVYSENYGLRVKHNQNNIFEINNNLDAHLTKYWMTPTRLNINGLQFEVSVWPSRGILFWESNWLLNICIICGFIITLMLAYLAQRVEKERETNKKLNSAIIRNISSQRMLSNIFKSSPDPLVIMNKRSQLTFMNQKAIDTFKLDASETALISKYNFSHLFTKETYDKINIEIQNFKRLIRQEGRHASLNIYAELNDGRKTPVEVTLISMEIEGRRSILARILDISVRKNYEHHLKHLNQDIKLIHDSTSLALEARTDSMAYKICLELICNDRGFDLGHVLLLNPSKTDEYVSSDVYFTKSSTKAEIFKQKNSTYSFAVGTGLPGQIALQNKPLWINDLTDKSKYPRADLFKELNIKYGMGFPITVKNKVIAIFEFFGYDDGAKNENLLTIFEVVSVQLSRIFERRQVLEELREAVDYNRLILESAQEGIISLDSQGRMNYINGYALKTLGYTLEEIQGNYIQDILLNVKNPTSNIENVSMSKIRNPVYNAIQFGKRIAQEDGLFTKKNGQNFQISYSCNPIMQDAKSIGAVLMFKDVSHERHTEEQLRTYTSEIKRANQELDEFAHTASIKTKEPIITIQKSAKKLMKNISEIEKDEAYNQLDKISKTCDKLLTTINGLHDFSKICHQLLIFENCELQNLVEQYLDKNQSHFIKKEASVIIAKKLPNLVCDGQKILETLSHLINNGINYNNSNTKKIIIDYYQNKTHHIITVTDNGEGISKSKGDNLFNILKRNEDESTQYSGAGMGLSISKRIIERHHGQIWFESNQGKGTIFYISISKEL